MTAAESSATAVSRSTDADGHVSLWPLFLLHLKVGNTVFGGGDPTMAALHSEFISNRRWISREKYGVVFALARLTPGTNLLAFCAGVSWELLGWTGAIAALIGLTAPAALIVLGLTHGYDLLKGNGPAMSAITALLAAAVGMMLAAAFELAQPYLNKRGGVYAGTIVVLAIVLSVGFSFSPIQILALAGTAGYFWQIPE